MLVMDRKYLLCGFLTQNRKICLSRIYTGLRNKVFVIIKYFFTH
jgi:hypothetical protein